jgi:basic membrane protein A
MRPSAWLAAALVGLGLAGCGTGGERRDGAGSADVGLVLSSGGRGDRGFNDAALDGARRAEQRLGARVEVSENVSDASRAGELERYARQGKGLVMGVSFMASAPAFELARKHPETRFAVLDYSPVTDEQGRALPPPPNLAGITYRAEEGAFLAGAVAGLSTRTGTVGFVGGMEAPVIRQFQAGYEAGVREVCPRCEVRVAYAGTTPAAFNDPARGKALAEAQYAAGADVVFHASGATGAGVFAAAREAGRWVIGVDVDQWDQAPGRVLTSVTKNLDVSVYGLIEARQRGTFRGGVVSQGLAEGAVGYVLDERNRPLLSPAVVNRVETLRAAVAAGLVKVPRVPAGRAVRADAPRS